MEIIFPSGLVVKQNLHSGITFTYRVCAMIAARRRTVQQPKEEQ